MRSLHNRYVRALPTAGNRATIETLALMGLDDERGSYAIPALRATTLQGIRLSAIRNRSNVAQSKSVRLRYCVYYHIG